MLTFFKGLRASTVLTKFLELNLIQDVDGMVLVVDK